MAEREVGRTQAYRTWNANIGQGVALGVYSVGNILLDMCCTMYVIRFLPAAGKNDDLSHILIYYFCAFALSLSIGAFADRLTHTGKLAAVGCVTVAAAMLSAPAPYVLAVMLGVGKACFQVGGGTFALRSDKKCFKTGIFIASGLIGIFAGVYAADIMHLSSVAVMGTATLAMAVMTAIILLTEPLSYTFETVAPFPKGMTVSYPAKNFAACVCYFAVTALRTFSMTTFNFPWRESFGTAASLLLLAGTSSVGVFLGGACADIFGKRATSAASLLLCAGLMLFSDKAAPSVAAVLLFNMSTPLTVRAVADVCRTHDGAVFGLSMFGTFVGLLPACFGVTMPFGIYGNAASALISMAVLAVGLELTNKRMKTL